MGVGAYYHRTDPTLNSVATVRTTTEYGQDMVRLKITYTTD